MKCVADEHLSTLRGFGSSDRHLHPGSENVDDAVGGRHLRQVAGSFRRCFHHSILGSFHQFHLSLQFRHEGIYFSCKSCKKKKHIHPGPFSEPTPASFREFEMSYTELFRFDKNCKFSFQFVRKNAIFLVFYLLEVICFTRNDRSALFLITRKRF